MKDITIAYIGGGSRLWARKLMSDLALEKDLKGKIKLYDIDFEAAQNNAKIGQMMMELPESTHRFQFEVSKTLEESLQDADFVLISILPGTFDDMQNYVHLPEQYGVYQPVGDTAGPAGLFRALMMMPMYQEIASAVKKVSPKAWVINFTNPMTLCVQMLYHFYPEIKAYGNCHEVFHVQEILALALKEDQGIDATREDIHINVLGINHFTWFNQANYRNIDLMPIYDRFAKKYQSSGLYGDEYNKRAPFSSAEKVKFDLYLKYGFIAAAGDRHLVEFLPQGWYAKDLSMIDSWKFFLTPVSHRKQIKEKGNLEALKMIKKDLPVKITPSGEEGVRQIRALLGLEELVTNVNIINQGQIPNLPVGHVVETNALFRKDQVRPIFAGNMPQTLLELTSPHIKIHQLLIEAYDQKDLGFARSALMIDPYVAHLSEKDKNDMFDQIILTIKPYLKHYQHQ